MWRTVVRDVFIPCNPDTRYVSVRTDTMEGNNEEVGQVFYDDSDQYVGGVFIDLASPMTYVLDPCTEGTPFPEAVPTDTDKIWEIIYNQATLRVAIYCNGVAVLDVILSDSVCTRSDWRNNWESLIPTKIMFTSVYDTASDEYSIMKRGMYLDRLLYILKLQN